MLLKPCKLQLLHTFILQGTFCKKNIVYIFLKVFLKEALFFYFFLYPFICWEYFWLKKKSIQFNNLWSNLPLAFEKIAFIFFSLYMQELFRFKSIHMFFAKTFTLLRALQGIFFWIKKFIFAMNLKKKKNYPFNYLIFIRSS